jgi:Ca-activated chloride channel family protein
MLGGSPANLFEAAHRRGRRRRLLILAAVSGALLLAGGVYALWSLAAAHGRAVTPTREVTLVIDVSGSMRASDVAPTRLGAAVRAAKAFLDGLPKTVSVGVVEFSDAAKIVQPPTKNRRRVLAALGRLGPTSGTALGSGLATGVRLTVRSRGGDIVLISDGSQNRGQTTPGEAAKQASAAGIRVYTVALGTRGGTVALSPGGLNVARIPVPPDPAVTQMIAGATGGEAFVAQDSAELGEAFDAVQRQLDG